MQQVFGCWVWDAGTESMVNRVTGERLRRAEAATRRFTDTPLAHHRLDYVHDDLEFPLAVSVERVLPGGPRHLGNREFDLVYRVDLARSARLWRADGRLPFGVWQRLCEFVPEAILFWPEAWPGVDDPLRGPGTERHVRFVEMVGAWRNGRWDGDFLTQVEIPSPQLIDTEAPVWLLPKSHWDLADLDAMPPSPFVFRDPRTTRAEIDDPDLWPDYKDIHIYLETIGFPAARPSVIQVHRAPADFVDHIPHCRSQDGSRLFFLGIRSYLGGHSSSLGPIFCIVSREYVFIESFASSRIFSTKKGEEMALRWDMEKSWPGDAPWLRLGSDDRSWFGASTDDGWRTIDDLEVLSEGRPPFAGIVPKRMAWRRLRQDLFDAVSAWEAADGVIPSWKTEISKPWERRPSHDLPILPVGRLGSRIEPLAGIFGWSKARLPYGWHDTTTVSYAFG